MAKQYLQTQDIFNKVFQNQSGALNISGYYSTQDYLNAVYDGAKDSLRVKIDGAMLPTVLNASSLPSTAEENSICPVAPGDGTIQFYQWNGTCWLILGEAGSVDKASTSKKIVFTQTNSTDVSWSGNVATFSHNLNCLPVSIIYNSEKEQVLFSIKVIDANSFSVDFVDKTLISGSWTMIVNYGAPYV